MIHQNSTSRSYHRITPAEKGLIILWHSQGYDAKTISKKLEVSEDQVKKQIIIITCNIVNEFTEKDTQILIKEYQKNTPIRIIAQQLNKLYWMVKKKVESLIKSGQITTQNKEGGIITQDTPLHTEETIKKEDSQRSSSGSLSEYEYEFTGPQDPKETPLKEWDN